ncbi:hypothetical protein BC361_25825 [Ensifer sp. LC54]|nr:hypothetical protein BC361_25825 [Ensifer sp. LC54]OCP23231.1 hypothetical protein BC363_24940 [Ensifer sp. LC384]
MPAFEASTPSSRAIRALRARAKKHNDPYLDFVADEFERTYTLMLQARRALILMEKAVKFGLKLPEEKVEKAP